MTNLVAGTPYAISYSYSPYFSPLGGSIFRGIREAMVIVPDGEEMVLRFSRFADLNCICAACISLIALLALFFVMIINIVRRNRVVV